MKRSPRTSRARRLARSLFARSTNSQRDASPWTRSTVRVESLEQRTLLAADFGYVLPGTGYFQQGQAMTTDAAGNVYLVATNNDVAKYDSAGNLIWFTPFTETGLANSKNSIAIDSTGNLYISGSFAGTGTFGSTTLLTGGNTTDNAFVAKLDPTGKFLWAKSWFSGTGSDAFGIGVDVQGDVYAGGTFSGGVNPGATTFFASNGGTDALIAKYDTSGNFLWAKQVGGAGTDDLQGLEVDRLGNVYATGRFSGVVDFDPGGAVYNLDGGFFNSAYVLKLDSSGNFRWADADGSIQSSTSAGMSLALDAAGNVYSTGVFAQGIFTGAAVDLDPTATGVSTFNTNIFGTDGYVQKLDTNGKFVWARQLHSLSSNTITPQGIAVDSLGDVYSTGIFQSGVDFNSGGASQIITSAGWDDAYVSEFDSRGNYVWSHSFGSTSFDGGKAVAIDNANNIYLAGYFSGNVNFDPGAITTQFRNSFIETSFLLKMTQASISGQAFNDENGNGLHDVAEQGLGGVAALLYQTTDSIIGNGDDQLIASTVTDSQGRYQFLGVASNTNYYVKFRTPVGFSAFSPEFVGTNSALWSTANASGTTGLIPIIPLENDVENVGLLGASPSFGFALAPAAAGLSRANSVGTDGAGNAYYAGVLNGTANFDAGAGTYNLTGANGAFVAKYSPTGALLWAEQIPVASPQGITNIKIDARGNVFAVGMFSGDVDFDPGIAVNSLAADASLSPFMLKLDPNGAFVWVHELAAGTVGTTVGLAIDSSNNVYTTGSFSGTANFAPSGASPANLTSQGSNDAFIAKYDRYGNFVYAQDFGGAFDDAGKAIAADSAGNVYVTGSFISSASITQGSFPATTYTLTGGGGGGTSFVLALDPTGKYLWSKAFVAGVASSGTAIAADAAGNVYSTGSFSGPGTFGGTTPLTGKVYISKLNKTGAFVWAEALDSDTAIQSSGLAVSPAGNAYVTGAYSGTTDFDPGLGVANFTSQNASADPYMLQLASDGTYVGVTLGGGPGADQSNAVAVDAAGNVFTAGVVTGPGNFNPAGTPAYSVGQAAATNLFLWKQSPALNVAPSFTLGPNVSVGEDTGLNTFPLWATSISAGPPSESGQRLTFHVSNDNVALFTVPPAIDPSTGTLTFTLAPFAIGVANMSVQLQDSGGTANGGVDASPLATFTITVNFVNHVPTFVAGPDQTTNEGAGSRVVSGWASSISPGAGPNDASQTLNFIVSNDNPGLFAVQPAISAVSGTLTYTLATYSSGVANVTVRLHDDGGTANGGIDTSPPQTFKITANFVNHAPSFAVGANQTVNEDAGAVSVAGWATSISPGPGANEAGQMLNFIVGDDNPSLFSVQPAVDASGKLTYTVAPNVDGIAHVTVKLHDDGGTANGGVDMSAAQNFTITVNFVNEAPSFTAGASQVQIENSGSVFVPGWATNISPGVGANEANQTLDFIVTAANPSLFLTQPSIDALTGDLSYVLANNASGTTTVTVQLHDNGGTAHGGVNLSPVQQFGVTITPVNQAPSFTAGPNVSALENAGAQTVANWATNISAGPPNESNQALDFIVANDNPALFSVQPAIDPVTGTLTYTLAANTSGAANVTVKLHDNGGTANGGVDTSAAQTFTITALFVNQAPSFLKGANQSVLEASGAHTVAGWATNISPGGGNMDATETLTFNVSNDNPGLFAVQPAVNPATGNLTYTLAPYASGLANVSIQLHDNGGTANGGVDTSPLATFTINVTFVNQAPSFTPGPSQTVNEDAAAQTVAGWASAISPGPGANETGQTLNFIVTNDNPALFSTAPSIDPTTGALTYAPAPNVNGTANVTVKLHDNGGTANGGVDTSAAQMFTITVNYVNDAPSFTAGPSQTVNENTGPFTVNNWASAISPGAGANEATQALTFNVSSDNPGLFSQQPAVDAFTGALSYSLAPNASGAANVTVQLHDNGGTANGGVDTSAAQSFTITVNLINSAPSFVKGADQTLNENSAPQTIAHWATAISPGVSAAEAGQALNFQVATDNPALFSQQPAIDATTGTLSYALAANASGVAHVSVRLHDNGGTANGGVDTSAAQTFAINVNFVNNPPSFSAGLDQNVNQDTGAHSVPGFATNISPGPGANEANQAVTFLVSNNNNSLFSVQPAISPLGTLNYTLAPGAVGTAQVTVSLKDNGGTANGGVDTSAPQTFNINVNHVNHAPTLANPLANQVMNENGADVQLSLAGVFADADIANFGDALSYSLAADDNTSLIAGNITGTTLSLHLLPDQFGTAHLTVRATDLAFATVDDLIAVTVNPVNHPPSFIPGPSQLVNVNAGHVSVPNWATGISTGPANEANQSLNFIVTNDNNSLFFVQPTISPSGTLDYTLTPGGFGTAHVTVRLHDSGGVSNGGVDTSPAFSFSIQVKAPPVANSDTYVLSALGTNSSDATGVLVNDSNPYGDAVAVRVTTGPTHGTLTLNPDGSFTYVKGPAFVAIDRFSYRIIDGTASSNSATVTVMSYEASTVVKLYQQVLHRAPDDAGLTYWTNLVQQGQPYSVVAQGIFESNERLDPIIEQYLQQFLLRPADAQGLAYWRDQVWRRDGGPDNVIAGMISSAEFFQSAGGTNAGWVTALYQRLLNRTPDVQGLNYWVQALNQHQMTETQVVLGFLKSDESFRNQISGFFQEYLSRNPSSSELDGYVARMQAGASARDVQLSIIASDEYRSTPTPPASGSMNRLN